MRSCHGAGRPLVVDHGTAIYVLGADDDAGSDSSALAHAVVESIAAGRLPLPDVRFIHAVSNMHRPQLQLNVGRSSVTLHPYAAAHLQLAVPTSMCQRAGVTRCPLRCCTAGTCAG